MNDSRDFDLNRMMEQIRLKVHDQRVAEAGSAAGSDEPGNNNQLQGDLAELDRSYDLNRVSLNPNRRLLGWTVLTASRLVSALLSPIIRRQSEYNAANTRVTTHLKTQVDLLHSQFADIPAIAERTFARSLEDFMAQVQALTRRLARTYADDIAMHAQALSDLSRRMAELEQRQAGWNEQSERLAMLERRLMEMRQELDRSGLASHPGRLLEQEHRLQEQDQRFAEQEQRLQEQDRRFAEQDQRFAEQDQRFAEQEHKLQEQGQHLAKQSQRFAEQEQRFAERDQRFESLDARNSELAAIVAAARVAQSEAQSQARSHYEEFKLTRERVLRAERRLRRLLSGEALNGAAPSHENPLLPSKAETEMDYAGFEDRLRDSQSVKDKQRSYLKYFVGKAPVIDVGCGKGEFLELMREAGIEAKGLDLDLDMVLQCREKGLDVERCDAIDYLAGQPDGSVGGIFSAQVIEHLTSAQLSALITLGWRKLAPGAIMVLETLNPESLFVHYKWFWMDPSHVRLVHPLTLQFLLESAGFAEISCHFASPPVDVIPIPPLQTGANGPPDDFNRATDYLNKLIYGDQEYFVVVRK